jgi:serine/threonine protein kinase
MSAQGLAVEDRLGDTTDHVMPPGETPGPRGGSSFVYASGSRPLSGYVIKRGVGTGGFGEVYYATSDAGKEVALKLIRRNLDTELRGMRQCLNLKHPNLVTLFDIREDDKGDTWVVMEYLSGKSLQAELADHPQGLPVHEALVWFHGIAAGVAYLHDHGIVHRDLKPGNIFCDEGIVKVGDYGLSKFISCSRRSGHTESIGTVHYMAPEVAHGRYGKELDIYALGAILYELVTGRVPFDGESVGEVLMKHLTAQPDLSRLAEPYRSVAAKALEKDPARRFASVSEMAAALPAVAVAATLPLGGAQRSSHAAGPTPAHILDDSVGPMPRSAPRQHAATSTIGYPDADQEPIALFVGQQLRKLKQSWKQSPLPDWVKLLILLGCIVVFLATQAFVLPLTMCALVTYGGYRIIRFIYRLWFCPAPSVPRMAVPVAVRRQEVKVSQPKAAKETTVRAFILKPLPERMTDLVGSLLIAAAVTAAMCVVALLVEAYRGQTLQIEQCAWVYLVSLAGAWCVLIPAKFWEGARGERMLRHFILMTIGLGLGLAAYGMADVLLVRLPGDYWLPSPFYPRYHHDGRPMVTTFMAAFATLMAVLRWWLDADPMRNTRLSLWSLVVSVVFAHFIATAWQFPEPWLIMVAACMSVAVQLSSPWVPTYARLRPQRKTVV